MNANKEDEIEEFKRLLHRESKTENFQSKIFFDGKQYSVRIPAKLAKVLELSSKNYVVKYQLKIPSTIKEKPELTINLEENNNANKPN